MFTLVDHTYNLPSRLLCYLSKGMVGPKTVSTAGNSGKWALLPWVCLSSLGAYLFWPGGFFGTCRCAFAHIQSCVCRLAACCCQDPMDTPASVQRHRGSPKGWIWYEWQEQERFLFVEGCHPLLCSIQLGSESCQWYLRIVSQTVIFLSPDERLSLPRELGDAAPQGAKMLSVSCGSKLQAHHTLIKTCF